MLKVFTDRYPLLGPLVWVLTVEYFITQVLVALAWHHPAYSWRLNTISDLGSTLCALCASRPVCSPGHAFMNASFVALGLLIAAGSLLIYQEFRENRGTFVGFSLMALGGFGTILVGLFPENTVSSLHILGATMPFLFGNLSLIILGLSLSKVSSVIRLYAFLSGCLALVALVFFMTKHYGPLGIGGVERLVAYPQTLWLIVFGVYMSRNHYVRARARKA